MLKKKPKKFMGKSMVKFPMAFRSIFPAIDTPGTVLGPVPKPHLLCRSMHPPAGGGTIPVIRGNGLTNS